MPANHHNLPVRQGDEDELFARHNPRLLQVVRRHVTTSAQNVEDACSFAWMQLFRHQPRRDTFFSWLTKVAIREAIRLDQRDRRTEPLDDPAAESGHADPSGLDEVVALHEALELVAQLPPRQAQILVLFSLGYSYREIAELLDATPRTVERQLMRAKRSLEELRAREEGENPPPGP